METEMQEQTYGHQGGKAGVRGWDKLRDWGRQTYSVMCKLGNQWEALKNNNSN